MKIIRVLVICTLIGIGAGAGAGCATARHETYSSVSRDSGLEKRRPSPTEDMGAMENTGYFVGWYSLVFLYGMAGVNAPLDPP